MIHRLFSFLGRHNIVVHMIKCYFVNEDGWIYFVAPIGLQVVQNHLLIEENIFERGFVYLSGNNFGYICTTCTSHMFVWHKYFLFTDVCKGMHDVVNFLSNN